MMTDAQQSLSSAPEPPAAASEDPHEQRLEELEAEDDDAEENDAAPEPVQEPNDENALLADLNAQLKNMLM